MQTSQAERHYRERTPRISRRALRSALFGALILALAGTASRFTDTGIIVAAPSTPAEASATPTKPAIKPFYTNDPGHCLVDLGESQINRPHCPTPQATEAPLIGKRVGPDQKTNTFEGPRSGSNDHVSWGLSDQHQSTPDATEPTATSTATPLTPGKTPSPTMKDCTTFSADDLQQKLCWQQQGR